MHGSEISVHGAEIARGQRFRFGENWARFLLALNEERIKHAEQSLREMLRVDNLSGKRFLDAGSGSGLFSLAAKRLGAVVYSFDYDPQSVACTEELKHRYYPNDQDWRIATGSVLDVTFLAQLGRFDVVYSWGVLHHAGAMWQALDNVVGAVVDKGQLFIAIYNDQGAPSLIWKKIKKTYCGARLPLRALILFLAFLRLWGPTTLRDLLRGQPGATWRNYGKDGGRGMAPWRDVVDWVGGYPFEVAKPEEILAFYRNRGFHLDQLRTCGGGLGCNEFVFTRDKT